MRAWFDSVRNGLTLIVGLLLLWQVLYLWTGDVAHASPMQTFRYTAKLFTEGAFGVQVWETLRAFAIAYAIAVVMGLAIGFWLGFDRLSGDALEPMVVSVYAIPKLTLYPILLLAFGLSLAPFLMVDQDLSPVDALKRSWEMTKGYKVTIFLFQLLGTLIYLVASTCALGIFIAVPMQVIGSAYIYLRIKGENPQAPT